MKPFDWNNEKNLWLQLARNVSFEDVVREVTEHRTLDDFGHFNQKKYPNQKVLVVVINGYACVVPYVENEEVVFLKTIISSRKANKKYLTNNLN